jgi:hypothetical protein
MPIGARPYFVEIVTSSPDPALFRCPLPREENFFKLLIKKDLSRLHKKVFKVRQIAVTPHFSLCRE